MNGWINAEDLESAAQGKPWFSELESVLSTISCRSKKECISCGSPFFYAKGLCRNCYERMRREKNRKERPARTPLAEKILEIFAENKSCTNTARMAGCSRSYVQSVVSRNGYRPRKRDDLKWPENLISAASMKLPEGLNEDPEAAVMFYLNGIDERRAKAIVMRYKDGKTLGEIGSEFGVTKEGARQIVLKGLSRIGAQTRMEEKRRETRETNSPELPVITGQIEDLDLSVRAYHCLHRAGIHTITDLMNYIKEKPLSKLRQCGVKTENEIMCKLKILAEEVVRP